MINNPQIYKKVQQKIYRTFIFNILILNLTLQLHLNKQYKLI